LVGTIWKGEFLLKHILIVDDDGAVRDVLKMIFASTIPEVLSMTARNGREAEELLNSSHVDLIMTDLNMPVMNGYELIAFRNGNYPHIPLIAMTGDSSRDVVRKLNILGITDCLQKPFSIDTAKSICMDKLTIDSPETTVADHALAGNR
jgi:CheY-like chemotaxis protein